MLHFALLALAALSTAATAGPLTIRTGESWAFSVQNGQPVSGRRIPKAARPARGGNHAGCRPSVRRYPFGRDRTLGNGGEARSASPITGDRIRHVTSMLVL